MLRNKHGSRWQTRNLVIIVGIISLVLVVTLWPAAPKRTLRSHSRNPKADGPSLKKTVQDYIDPEDFDFGESREKAYNSENYDNDQGTQETLGFLDTVKNLVGKPLATQKSKQKGVIASTGKLFKGEKIREFPLTSYVFNVGRPEKNLK